MKIAIVLTLLLHIVGNASAQKLTQKQAEYFILGTLSDSDGRVIDPSDKDEFDYYFQWEKPLVYTIDSILKVNYLGIPFHIRQNRHPEGIPRYYFINSKFLCNKYSHYYKFEPTGSRKEETEYHGLLTKRIFNSEDEKLAFLAGAYSRFGEPTDTAYCIHISSSLSKVKVCYELLKDLKCKCYYQILDNIPTQMLVYFHPTEQVKSYLRKNAYINSQIIKSKNLFFKSIYDRYHNKK